MSSQPVTIPEVKQSKVVRTARRLGCRDYRDPVTITRGLQAKERRSNMKYFLNLGDISSIRVVL